MNIPNQQVFVSPPAKSHIPETAHAVWCSQSWFIFVAWKLKLILLTFFIQVGFVIKDVHLNMTVLKAETPPKISSNVHRTDNKAQLRRNFPILCQESNAVKFKSKKNTFYVQGKREVWMCAHIFYCISTFWCLMPSLKCPVGHGEAFLAFVSEHCWNTWIPPENKGYSAVVKALQC